MSYVRDACRNVLTSACKVVIKTDQLNTISIGLTLLINFSSALFQAAVAQLITTLSYKSKGSGLNSRWGHWFNTSRPTFLGSTQPLTETTTRDYCNTCTVHLLLFCTMTNKCTIISQIITLLHVSTLSCHPHGLVINALPSYTSISNAAVGNTVPEMSLGGKADVTRGLRLYYLQAPTV